MAAEKKRETRKRKGVNYHTLAFNQSVALIVSSTSSLIDFCNILFSEEKYDLLNTILAECDLLEEGIDGFKKATGISYRTIARYSRDVKTFLSDYQRETFEYFKSRRQPDFQGGEPRKPIEVIYMLDIIGSHVVAIAEDAVVKGHVDEESEEKFLQWFDNFKKREEEKEKIEAYRK